MGRSGEPTSSTIRTVCIAKKIEANTKRATRRCAGMDLATAKSAATAKQKRRDRSIEETSLVAGIAVVNEIKPTVAMPSKS